MVYLGGCKEAVMVLLGSYSSSGGTLYRASQKALSQLLFWDIHKKEVKLELGHTASHVSIILISVGVDLWTGTHRILPEELLKNFGQKKKKPLPDKNKCLNEKGDPPPPS